MLTPTSHLPSDPFFTRRHQTTSRTKMILHLHEGAFLLIYAQTSDGGTCWHRSTLLASTNVAALEVTAVVGSDVDT